MQGKSVQELEVGEAAELSVAISHTMVEAFAEATGDFNPLHLDEDFAAESIFKGRIAHGALSFGLISRLFSTFLGPGSFAVSQELQFLGPMRLGDIITVRIEVLEVIPERNRGKFRTTCTNQDGKVVVDGIAWGAPARQQLGNETASREKP